MCRSKIGLASNDSELVRAPNVPFCSEFLAVLLAHLAREVVPDTGYRQGECDPFSWGHYTQDNIV